MVNWAERGHVCATNTEDVVYCQVVGAVNMNNSAPFESYARRQQQVGCKEFILDFSLCAGLDSTFLGIVLGLRLGPESGGDPPRITAVNVSRTVFKTLREVGIDRLIEVRDEPVDPPGVPLTKLEGECSEEERLGMILSAHESLCEMGAENRARFSSFVELLRGEIDGGVAPDESGDQSGS
ncbi:MAG: STAS domain-containing protein [Planctomycetota bacterium]|jgi:anti-sigma B factor antagonist